MAKNWSHARATGEGALKLQRLRLGEAAAMVDFLRVLEYAPANTGSEALSTGRSQVVCYERYGRIGKLLPFKRHDMESMLTIVSEPTRNKCGSSTISCGPPPLPRKTRRQTRIIIRAYHC